MAGEKRFGGALFGFNRSDVNIYIEKMLKEFDESLKSKDAEIDELKKQNKDLKSRYEELLRKSEQINEDRAKIADVLIKAQEKAEVIIEEARAEAMEEKKRLDGIIEQEREKLVDIKQELKELKSEVVNTLKKYELQLNDMIDSGIKDVE